MLFKKEFPSYYVYIITNKTRTVLYTDLTNHLEARLEEHRQSIGSVFTAKYKVKYLLYFEEFAAVRHAIAREKQIKGWRREKKINLIRTKNPNFNFLNYLFE